MKPNTAFLSFILSLGALAASAAEFTFEKTAPGGAIVKLDGQFFTELVVDQANKTYLWPVIGAEGKTMTRKYPMQTVPGEQHDHPHHRGLCFGHQDIGGYNTWAEQASFGSGPKGDGQRSTLGAIKLREITEMKGGEKAVLKTVSDYVDGKGKKTLEEVRTYTFQVKGGNRLIDVDVDLIATEGDTVVGDEKDAGLSIRVPTEMAVEKEKKEKGNGHIINANGDKDDAAWGKRATWCDYYGTVEGTPVGVAMLNHPSSFRHPTPWHVRTYGLFTANPFGLKALDPKSETGAFTLKKGEKITLRHRFVFHKGDAKEGKVAEAFADYAKE